MSENPLPPAPSPHPALFLVRRDLSYAEGVDMQREALSGMAADPGRPGVVIMAEHRPVVTRGRSGGNESLLASREKLAARGIEFHPAVRGGDVTYHGPGQWTVYPVLRLDWYGRNIRRYLRLMEECALRFLSLYGLPGRRRPGLTGAWVGEAKVAAVGVAASRWISWHGFALNIHPDLSCFTDLMRPCGIGRELGTVASLDSLTGVRHEMEETLPALRQSIREALELEEKS